MARILLVDDEPALLDSLGRILRVLGHTVETAHDGKWALDLLQTATEGFDLVITDENMPEVGGPLLLELMRNQGIETPTMIMGGYITPDRAEKLKQQGFAEAIQKPISVSDLNRLVTSALAN